MVFLIIYNALAFQKMARKNWFSRSVLFSFLTRLKRKPLILNIEASYSQLGASCVELNQSKCEVLNFKSAWTVYVPIKRILDRVFKKVLFSDYSTNPKSERYFKKFETAASI